MSKVAYQSNIWGGPLPASSLTLHSTANDGVDPTSIQLNSDGTIDIDDGLVTTTSGGPVTISQDPVQGGAATTSRLLIADFKSNADRTVAISRTEGGGGPADVGSALKVITVLDADGVSQGEGLTAAVQTSNNRDVVGVSSAAVHSGTGNKNAFAFFGQAIATGATSGAIAFQTDVQNHTGAAVPYTQTSGGNNFIGVDLVFDTTTAARDSGCAAQIRWNGGSGWDVGIGISGGGVKTSIIDNDADAVTLWNDTGAHTDGLNFSGATFSGSQIKFAMGTSLTNAANDGAAAAAGVPVGGIYRNGSVLMVRVA